MRDVTTLIIVLLGAILIVAGVFVSLRKQAHERGGREDSAEGLVTALTKLLETILRYPPGMILIIFGIVVLAGGIYYGTKGPSDTAAPPTSSASAPSK